MKKLELDEIKKMQFELLIKFDEICKKYELTYYLEFGTLLGSVRHKGFIPWDDDIDVGMPREDYEKLNVLIGNTLIENRYELINYKNPKFIYVMSKFTDHSTIMIENIAIHNVCGVYIDVFPLDTIRSDKKSIKKMYNQLIFLHHCLNISSTHNIERTGFFKKCLLGLLAPCCRFVGYKNWIKLINYTCKKYSDPEKGDCCAILSYFSNPKEFVKNRGSKSIFSNYIFSSFEGHNFPIPIGYDQWLKNIYGDYMKLPPIEKRISKHDNEIWKV
jgi:lipopolysaccharide cholinephosphotransferase